MVLAAGWAGDLSAQEARVPDPSRIHADKLRAPYLRRMIWRYRSGRFEGVSSEDTVVEWDIFDGDVYKGVVTGR